MKMREIKTSGYENGVYLANGFKEDGLVLHPEGEIIECGYRLVNKNSFKKDHVSADEGVNMNLLDEWEKRAIAMGNLKWTESIRQWTEKDFLRDLQSRHRKYMEEVLDQDRYPEVQGMARYKDQEAKGIADVLGVDYLRVLLCKDIYRRPMYSTIFEGIAPNNEDARGCTTLLFKDSDVGPILGRNMDSGTDAIEGLKGYGEPVLYKLPEEMGRSYISIGQVNEAGLIVQGSSISYPGEPMYETAFKVDIYELVLRYAKTVNEAIELITRYMKFLDVPSNLLIADASGDAAVVEKSKRTFAVRRTPGHTIFTTSGVAVEDKTRALMDTNSESYISELKRHHSIENYFKNCCEKEGERTVEAMWEIVTDHSVPGPVCRHIDNQPPHSLYTLYSFVMIPRENIYYFRLAKPGPAYPCQEKPVLHPYSF